jgi:alpha-1,2-mannosyltransferase
MAGTRLGRRNWAARAVPAAVVGASAAGLVAHLWRLSDVRSRIDLHIYFSAVKQAFPGHLYDFKLHPTGLGFAYPPFAALVLKPITALSFTAVDHGWLIATVVASAAFVAVGVRELPTTPALPGYRTALVAACLWAAPIYLTARIGQINAFLALAMLIDFVAARRDRPWAGVPTGLAAALKLTPGIAVLAMIACGYRRAAGRAVAAGAAVTALAFAVAWHDSWRYWTSAVFDIRRVGTLSNGYSNSLRRMLTLTHLPSILQAAVWAGLTIALLLVAYLRARGAGERGNALAALVIVTCCGFAIAPITWSHHLYFFVLVLPLVIGDGRHPLRLVAALGVALLLFEWHNPGQNTTLTAIRGLVLPLVVLALPIDRVTKPAPRVQPAQS